MKLKRINKVLLLFLSSLIVCFFVFVQTIQSKWFVSMLSSTVDGYFKEYVSKELRFSDVELQLFPPGIEIGHITSTVKNKDIHATLYAGKLGVYFNIIDFFSRKLSVKEIAIKDSIIEISKFDLKDFEQNESTDKKIKKLNEEEVIKLLRKKLNNLPIKLYSISLYNTNINYLSMYQIDIKKVIAKINDRNFALSVDINSQGDLEKYGDNLKGEIIINPNQIDVYNLSLKKKTDVISVSGEIKNVFDMELLNYNINLDGNFYFPHIHDYLEFKKIGEIEDGWLDLSEINVKGNLKKIQGTGKLLLRNLKSKFANAESLSLEFESNEDEFVIDKFKLNDVDGLLTLKNRSILYSYKKDLFVPNPVNLIAKNFDLNNALSILQDYLKPLSGKINGPIIFEFNKPNFKFITKKETFIEKLKLQFDDSKILEIDKAFLIDGEFKIENYMFSMKSNIVFDDNHIPIVGEVKKDGVYFSALDSVIDLSRLGPIVNLDIEGKSEIDIIVGGKFSDTKLFINGDITNAKFQKIKLGNVEIEKVLHISKKYIEFKKLEGVTNNEAYNLKGIVDFGKFNLDLKGKIPNITYLNLQDLFTEFLPDINFYEEYFTGPLSIDFNIKSKESDFLVEGSVEGSNLFFINESINKLKTSFYVDKSSFKLNGVNISKGTGSIKGDVDVNLKSGKKLLGFKYEKILLSEFNFYKMLPLRLNGTINGDVDLLYSDKIENLNFKVDLLDSKILTKSVPNSLIRANYKDTKLDLRVEAMDEVKFKSSINFDKNKKSFAFINIDIEDVSRFLIAYLGLDSNAELVRGKLIGDLNASFFYDRLENLDLSSSINEFFLKKDDIFIQSDSAQTIIVKDGVIKDWNIEIKGENAQIISRASGNFSNTYKVETLTNYSASLIEVLSNKIVEAKGKISNRFMLNNRGHNFVTSSQDLYLDIDGLPTYITDAKYKFIFRDYKFIVESFTAKLKEGEVRLKGEFIPKFPYPEINFNFELDKAKFYLFKNSNIILSSSGTIFGSQIPYKVNASVVQEGGEIFDELKDMTDEDISTSLIRNKFLPKLNRAAGTGWFDINASLISNSPIWVKNSNVDIKLIGNLEVKGLVDDLKVSGEYKILPAVSKLSMKNNDFKVRKGSITFDGTADYKDPKLNILSDTTIDKYTVRLRAFGQVSSLALDLSSDPFLNTPDILSLIALGYTDKVSQQLNDGQQQSLSSIGIGAILFDQLKFNDSLKKNFGLQVNLGTAIQENTNSSLIDGRGGGAGDNGRFRSATKIEVKKKLNDIMDIAISSTVGGDIGQQQKMNLNLNLKKDLTLEMIYENRTNLEDDRATDADSFGLDVRYKQDFK